MTSNVILKLNTTINAIRSLVAAAFRPADPLPAHCGNIHALLLHLCDNDRELCKWVMRWIAYPLQHPGKRMSTGLVINGPNGNGKSMLFGQVVAKLHGHQASIIQADQLHQRFTAWNDDARLVVIDSDTFTKPYAARLKTLITSDVIHVQRKGLPRRLLRNKLNFVFLSGCADFLPLEMNDRRFAVIESPAPLPRRYYQAIATEIENGGIEDFHHYLTYALDMGDFGPHTPPPNRAAVDTRPAKSLAAA